MDTSEIPLNIFLDLSQAFDTSDHTILSTYKYKRHFFRHGRRTGPKFGTHVRIDTLTLKKLNFF